MTVVLASWTNVPTEGTRLFQSTFCGLHEQAVVQQSCIKSFNMFTVCFLIVEYLNLWAFFVFVYAGHKTLWGSPQSIDQTRNRQTIDHSFMFYSINRVLMLGEWSAVVPQHYLLKVGARFPPHNPLGWPPFERRISPRSNGFWNAAEDLSANSTF